ncbi:MAG: CDP-glucose 4,6-dehydratase [Nitrospirae bacterium]|nr:CDP-glucose 4,6-dehydratase [Nitrospirota bacterium]
MKKAIKGIEAFNGAYRGKRVLVTGHTGFKGSWLSHWLLKLGADVAGFSLYLPSQPCNFEVTGLRGKLRHYEGDIRNIAELKKVFKDFKPQMVFHLAAQAIVRKSFDEPKETFDTNLGGTVNVLECVRDSASVQAAVIITSDKCYRNLEWEWGYRENDILGGDDPYSASKACAEIASSAYIKSCFNAKGSARIATARAGNVVGGGDWAKDRIIPDCVRAWSNGGKAVCRNPEATRPWQHVLEPLSGYLWLGAGLIAKSDALAGEAFNFGPDSKVIKSVSELVNALADSWGNVKWEHVRGRGKIKEQRLLKLSCDKALNRLGWHSILGFGEVVALTAQWYKHYYAKKEDIFEYSSSQIDFYMKKGMELGMPWIQRK